ncbi:ABC transporter permease [Ruminococcus sp. YE282]|jgi:lipopolysaccharide transport system permease protein|uniref:ABC transporter permease n=1 Tax=Ruminococcus sp. YE282 TaxID=3158780 RepID=UPI00088A5CD8|nr:ABC transporter permease [Ruminococcus bromii]MEE3498367.1 ABC transporter permease [Ruminococcus bromii]SCY60401.1 lipopolysaccharide transport system permease protein [Ruminococcus bromii]HCB94567.1 ABC transporter permease [Ruminococcus sp.]
MAEKNRCEKYHTHISSKQKRFDLNIKEIWRYRDLVFLFTKRRFQLTYKQTILGPAWIFINPFLTSIVFTFLFGKVAGMSTDGVPQFLFYLSSNAIWSFFSASLTNNATTFTSNSGLFGKVYFPRLTVPISNVLSSAINFFVQMLMVMLVLVYYLIKGKVSPNWTAWLLIPFVLLVLGAMGLGLGIIISSLTTKYRDLSILVGFGVTLWMYATPIVYPISQLGDGIIKTILYINPVTAPVELFRYAVLGKGMVSLPLLAVSLAFTTIVLLIGILVFNRVEKTFMDTV